MNDVDGEELFPSISHTNHMKVGKEKRAPGIRQ